MADSSLVTYEDYNVPYTSGRTSGVGCVCVHHMAGNLDTARCCQVWRNSGVASAHYCIDSKGNIGQAVREKDCAWACGNKWANNCSISIECANDGGAPSWHVSDATINACINLLVDICKRHGWTQFRYTGSLKTGELFAHREVASTACPGDYLYSKFPYIASEVQKRLDGATEKLYRVRKSWSDSKTQAGAYKKLENAKKKADEKASEGYKVFDWDGNCVYEPTTAQLYRVRKTWADSKSQIGAYKSLERAIKVADEHEGYKVFDSNGACVYEPVAKAKEEAREEPKEEAKVEPKAEEKKAEEKTEPKTEAKTEKKKSVSKKKQKSILARLKEKYGKAGGR